MIDVCTKLRLLITLFTIIFPVATVSVIVPNALVPPGFQATIWASNLTGARQIECLPNGDILLLRRRSPPDATNLHNTLNILHDSNGNGESSMMERNILLTDDTLTHAVVYHDGYLYASSASEVYRWRYSVGGRTPSALGPRETIIADMIPELIRSHNTRSLVFDTHDRLYVHMGSVFESDFDRSHSLIRRFNLTGTRFPIPYSSGQIVASGIRNSVGFTFDASGILWVTDNGYDRINDQRPDLMASMENNPADELNRIDVNNPARYYGHPHCVTSGGGIPSFPVGSQFGTNRTYDRFCQSPSFSVPPALTFTAHSVPLGIRFYSLANALTRFGFPSQYVGDAFVALRGGWARVITNGFRVVRVRFSNGRPMSYEPFFWWNGSNTNSPTLPQNDRVRWNRRPVSLCVGPEGDLFVSDDLPGTIIRVRYIGAKATPTKAKATPTK